MRKNLLMQNSINGELASANNEAKSYDTQSENECDFIPEKFSLIFSNNPVQNIVLYAYCQIVLDKECNSDRFILN